MPDRAPVRILASVLLLAAGAAAVGVTAYNTGVQRGLVEASRAPALPEAATHVYVLAAPWHGAFFPLFPFVVGFVAVAILVRAFAWRGRGGCGPGRRGGGGVPPAFTDWHRREHERMAGTPAPDRTA